MSGDGTGTELKPQEYRGRENKEIIFIGSLEASAVKIFKNRVFLRNKSRPSSWFVCINFSSSRDFNMLGQSYIYKSYSVPCRDLAQRGAPSAC